MIASTYLPEPAAPTSDEYGRGFITHHGRRYLVPFMLSATDIEPTIYWHFHERLRLACPADNAFISALEKRTEFWKYQGPKDYEGGSCIFLIPAESLAAAAFVAVCAGLRITGWDVSNPSGRDCSGQTFASAAETFRFRDSHDAGCRNKQATYGFYCSWARDI